MDSSLLYNNCDENMNNCNYKSITSAIHLQVLSSKNGNDLTSIDRLNKSLQDLSIDYVKKTEWDQGHDPYLAGRISKTITSLNIVLVQPISSDTLLQLEAPLFLSCAYAGNSGAGHYVLLGHVDDIFGSIGEPMYSVRLIQDLAANIFKVGQEVYYLPNDPNTQLIYVEQVTGNTFNKVRYNIRVDNEHDIYEQ